MKILIASFTYPPEQNGVSHVVHAHASGLAARGHEVIVATAYNKGRKTSRPAPRLKVEQFNVSGNGNLRAGYHGDISRYQDFIA